MSELVSLQLKGSKIRKLPSSIGKLAKLCRLSAPIAEESFSLQKQACGFGIQGIENLTNLEYLVLGCMGLKCIPQFPSTLRELEPCYVTTEMEFPDFSNLKKLCRIEFEYCSLKEEQAGRSLRQPEELNERRL
ncbi:hypothetical protein CDL15_Pgr017595 [Punica granatum]|uniref:Uncharacterized protein n=1 Tax=Punica granatum TaxID=22663 RepID=A0A218W598_PUNGR|nr:hypothetical protein CDL15_Pgr017595 [Punica granatum]